MQHEGVKAMVEAWAEAGDRLELISESNDRVVVLLGGDEGLELGLADRLCL